MAKRAATTAVVSKSDAIRAILKQHPQATMKEIQAALKERGVSASDALVNKIKYGRKSSKSKKSSARRSNRGPGSKADAIRDAWSELGATARPRDVISRLAKRGMSVTAAQVSVLRKSRGPARPSVSSLISSVALDHLMAAKKLADRLGGIATARQALESLAKLMDE